MFPEPRLDWRSAATFLVADPDWRRKVLRGGLLLLFPPLGWPVALGYRKMLIGRLTTRAEPLLPAWKGNVGRFWCEGMKALGVIFAHYLPLYLFCALRVWERGLPELPWLGLLAFFGFFFLLSPFLLPAVVTLSSEWVGEGVFTPVEVALVFAFFAGVTFLIPAGFLQVSRTGRYLSAFRLLDNVRFVCRHFRLYVEAWLYSSLTSLIGHFCFPFTPWGVFWCYQSIVYSFNEIRLHTGDEEDRELHDGPTWFSAFADGGEAPSYWEEFALTRNKWWEEYRPRAGSGLDPVRDAFAVFKLGDLRAPLPVVVTRWLPL